MGAVEKVELVRVAHVARAALKSASGDVQRATSLMARRVRGDMSLYRELMDELVESACYASIRDEVRDVRRNVWMAPNYDAGGNGERVKSLAAGNALMFFPLPNGKLLAHATRVEVEEAASFYAKQSENMGTKARWLALVAKRIEGNKTVGKCLTETQLRTLQEKANG